MGKKKNTSISVSQEEHAQAQHVLEQYHQIAENLRLSKDQEQAETALAEINNLPESAQMALLKELSKENQVDAADVLTAINELSPLKSVRKEARRSLIRLESAKIYPNWEPPIDRTPAISTIQPPTNPPRFWKGLVSDTLKVQLLLFWEQGEDYKEVRILGFYLDFQHEGIKDFFTSIDNKRGVEKFIARLATQEIEMEDCSLALGRQLVRNALAFHARHGTTPPRDYQSNRSLINQLIFEAEDTALDEESNILHDLEPQDIVINFAEAWANGVYGMAYDILSNDSPLREGLSRDEWIEHRKAWAKEANPRNLKPNYLYEREQHKSSLWLPTSFNVGYSVAHKEVEAGWSMEMDETPLSDTLPELPKATAIYEETGRHWFWTSYTLVEENGDWRIQSITDEGAIAQNLPIDDLQNEIQNLDKQMAAITKMYKLEEIMHLEDDSADYYLEELVRRLMQGIYYTDALINKLPFDQSNYEDAASRMVPLGQFERCLAYLIPMIQRFPEKRALYLRRKAWVQRRLSDRYSDQNNNEQAKRYWELAQESLHESLAIENSFDAHMFLAELLAGDDKLDEAKDHLLQAKELLTASEVAAMHQGQSFITDEDDSELQFSDKEAHIEFHLGEIAAEREEYQEALSYYQRTVELQPDSASAWFALGETHQALEHFEEAETAYKRAIELDPESIDYYYTFSQMYTENDQPVEAIKVLEEGLNANPDSATLCAYIALQYMEIDNYRQAEIFLNKAERIDPEYPLIGSYRQLLNLRKPQQIHATNKMSKPLKQKKKKKIMKERN